MVSGMFLSPFVLIMYTRDIIRDVREIRLQGRRKVIWRGKRGGE